MAACAFMGASLATLVATTGMVESDLRTGNNRSPVEFTAELMGAALIGFGAGATVYGVIAAAPALAAGASTEAAIYLGKTNFTEKVVPNIIKASGGAIAAAETVFSVNDAYACGSGYNPLLEVAYDGDIEAYEVTEFCIDILALGYVQAAEVYGRSCSSEGVYIESENNLNDYDDYKDEIYPLYSKKANTGEFSKLKEPITIEHVKMICEDAGIDYSGIKIKIADDPDLVGSGFLGYTHPDGKTVDLYPDAFKNRETLVKTLGHERIHIMQNRLYGPPQDSHMCGLFEEAAMQSEEDWWNYYKSVNGGN